MAAGSEKFKWNLFPLGTRKVCRECGREPLKIDDVGEHRRRYPGGRDEFLCKTCQQRRVAAMVERKRIELGFGRRP